MKRTQIYFDEDTFKLLYTESEARKLSISEVIRDSIRRHSKDHATQMKRKISSAFGAWNHLKISTEKHIRSIREDRKI